jgi:Virus neck protein
MPINKLFPRGAKPEQSMVESLIIESIKQYGREFYYLPRKFVALDHLFGEDPLSKFEYAYQIEGYLDNVDNYGGNGMFMSKFGMFIEEQGQITIARKRWEHLISRHGETVIPSRPAEGDLIYFPTTKGLFEIKFVEHQNPFYQLGRLYVYKLKVELFQYASERIDTGIEDIDNMALDMTFDILGDQTQEATPAKRNSFDNTKLQTEAGTGDDILNFDQHNPFGE